MKEYRKRFVQLNMLLIGTVLLLMLSAIAIYMCRDYYDSIRTTMEQVVRPLDSVTPASDDNKPVEGKSDEAKSGSVKPSESKRPAEYQETPAEEEKSSFPVPDRPKEITVVFYKAATEEISILSHNTTFDADTLAPVMEAISAQEEAFGILPGYPVIYYRTGNGSPYKIAIASIGYLGHSIFRLIAVLLAVWLGAMLCFLLVSIQLSKIAVRPMEEAMLREKQFVADASHDLKTPLSVILANNSILQENPAATVGSLKRWTDSTQNAAKRMQHLIGEMLTLANVERPDVPLVTEPVDISSVVTKEVLQLESVAYEKNVLLETEIPEQIILSSNAEYLQRIAGSLIENAIKYEPSGGVVRICLTQEKRKLSLTIQNQNTTISENDLPHIFDRFYRSDKSRQTQTGGHGLGLAIAKEMVEKLNGHLTVTSCTEKGTVFTAIFPL